MLTIVAGIGIAIVAAVVAVAFFSRTSVRRLGAGGVPSRTDRLVGLTGKVTHAIDPIHGGGRVLVAGEDWAAQSFEPIPVETRVIVDGADGIVLTVTAET